MRRLLISGVVVAGLTAPTVLLMAPAAHAGANGIVCNKIKGTAASTTTVSNCAPVNKANKKAFKTLVASSISLATGGTMTWNGGATLTIGAPSFTAFGGNGNPPIPAGACPKNGSQNEYIASATVTSGDGVVSVTGDTFSANICVDKKGKFYLSPGTKIQI